MGRYVRRVFVSATNISCTLVSQRHRPKVLRRPLLSPNVLWLLSCAYSTTTKSEVHCTPVCDICDQLLPVDKSCLPAGRRLESHNISNSDVILNDKACVELQNIARGLCGPKTLRVRVG